MIETVAPQPPTPYFATWHCTLRCNLRCAHCYIPGLSEIPGKHELSTREARVMFEQLAEADVYQLSFAGGEPLLRTDFFELSHAARSAGLTVQVSTNGTSFDEQAAERLLEAGYQCVQISIDGTHEGSNSHTRGQGMFARAVRALEAAHRAGLPTVLAIAIHRRNVEDISSLRQFATQHRVEIVKLQPVTTPFTFMDGQAGELDARRVRTVLATASAAFTGSSIKLSVARTTETFALHGARPTLCSEPPEVATIFVDGSVSACCVDQHGAVGCIPRDGFVGPWRESVARLRARGRCACHQAAPPSLLRPRRHA